jgi:uncharacterized membrane protein YdfJ with MMPL/SSD domain
MGHREEEDDDERSAQGEIAGEGPEGSDGGTVAGVVLHRDDALRAPSHPNLLGCL